MPGGRGTVGSRRGRALLVGWFSFVHGEATAGDVLGAEAVQEALAGAGIDSDVAWSPAMCPAGGVRLERVSPRRYTDLVFVCGPAHGQPVRELHDRFAHCRRVAIGVSVLDPDDPAVAGFDHVLARDAPGARPLVDLAAGPRPGAVPVAGIVLTGGQREYGDRRRHERVTSDLTAWLLRTDCARLPLDTRMDPRDWRLCASPGQLESVMRRLDVVVTTRLHGLVLALKNGVPALAVDPVAGGGKVTAQAAAWRWPAVLPADGLDAGALDRQWAWCLSPDGRGAAGARAGVGTVRPSQLHHLLRLLRPPGAPGGPDAGSC
jgi:hypothetical protein